MVAGWWLLFTVPCLLWVRETPGKPAVGPGSVVARGFRQLRTTFGDVRRDRRLLLFLAVIGLYLFGRQGDPAVEQVATLTRSPIIVGRGSCTRSKARIAEERRGT